MILISSAVLDFSLMFVDVQNHFRILYRFVSVLNHVVIRI
jgi:hypothetical protein